MNPLIEDGPTSSVRNIHYTLLIASVLCLIGHGAFGIITKPIWCNYFAVFGIGHDLAYRLMPVLGTVDILLGLSLLIYPTRAVLGWLVIWAIVTASLRPLSGEPFAEFIERAGNFGAPLALLLLSRSVNRDGTIDRKRNNTIGGEKGIRSWFTRIGPGIPLIPDSLTPRSPSPRTGAAPTPAASARLTPGVSLTPKSFIPGVRFTLCLRIIVFLLLLGHGWLNLIGKKGLLLQYEHLGFSHPAATALYAGLFEILAAIAILVRPVRPLLLALLVWKAGTELLYPHWELFEWVERGGSYGSLLALWMTIGATKYTSNAYTGNNKPAPSL
jgi:hypothetical protein